jgi:hypothetical protein
MSVLAILKGILQVAGMLAEWARNRSLIKAGEAKAVSKGLVDAFNAIEVARHARNNIDSKRLRAKFKRPPNDG